MLYWEYVSQLCMLFSQHCRNVDSEKRPLFSSILSSLLCPDYQVITWSQADEDTYSEKSRTISGILQDGQELFLDLQHFYL